MVGLRFRHPASDRLVQAASPPSGSPSGEGSALPHPGSAPSRSGRAAGPRVRLGRGSDPVARTPSPVPGRLGRPRAPLGHRGGSAVTSAPARLPATARPPGRRLGTRPPDASVPGTTRPPARLAGSALGLRHAVAPASDGWAAVTSGPPTSASGRWPAASSSRPPARARSPLPADSTVAPPGHLHFVARIGLVGDVLALRRLGHPAGLRLGRPVLRRRPVLRPLGRSSSPASLPFRVRPDVGDLARRRSPPGRSTAACGTPTSPGAARWCPGPRPTG